MRSQLGFTSIRLPTSGRHRNILRRLFNFTRSRRSGSLALVSAGTDDGSGAGTGGSGSGGGSSREPERLLGSHRGLLPLDSDDTDTESEHPPQRRDTVGAVGGGGSGTAAPLPQKTPPTTAVEAIVSVSTSLPQLSGRESSLVESLSESSGTTTTSALPQRSVSTSSMSSSSSSSNSSSGGSSSSPGGRSQLSSALSRMTRGLRWVRFSLTRSSGGSGGGSGRSGSGGAGPNHSPLRQLEHGSSGCGSGGVASGGGTREDEDDVELLIPVADVPSVALSDGGNGSGSDCSRPLLEGLPSPAELVSVGPLLASSPALASAALRGRPLAGRDGPCEHCGMVHTARIPDACLEATSKTETSDDEALLLC